MSIGSEVKKHTAMLKKVFLTLALLPVAATVCLTVLFVLPGIKDPVSLLKFSRKWYVVFSFALFVLWTGTVFFLVRMESRLLRGNSKGIIVLAGIINAAALLWMLSSLILSACAFSVNVGTVRISKTGELSYIRNYPDGNYMLTRDIDMEKEIWKSIPKFRGSLDGNGHSILNITVGRKGFIRENQGTISSLTLSNVEYMDFDPGKEYGTLVAVNRGRVLSCAISPADSGENPEANVLVGCNYGICENNTGFCYDRCEEHTYELVSSTPATFLKHGINSYFCEECGDAYKSVAVSSLPVKIGIAIVLLLVTGGRSIYNIRLGKDGGIEMTVLGTVFFLMIYAIIGYIIVAANVGKGETWIDRRYAYNVQTETNSPEEDHETEADSEDGADVDSGFVFPNSDTELIEEQEAQNLSDRDLAFAINEIYARHGYLFQNNEVRGYYEQFDWYNDKIPSVDVSADSFNEIERQNWNMLVNERNRRKEYG